MRLRQVVWVAETLEPLCGQLRRLLDLGPGFADPGVGHFGLENRVFAVGDTFMEVVAPTREGTAAGRYLERFGAGGYMVLLQVDDMAAERARLQELGVRVVWRGDHDDIMGTHLHPRDVGGAIVSLDQAVPPSSWRWAGPDWETQASGGPVRGIVGADFASAEPRELASRWSRVLDLPVIEEDGAWRIELEDGDVRFDAAVDTSRARTFDHVTTWRLRVEEPETLLERARELGLAHSDASVEVGGVELSWAK